MMNSPVWLIVVNSLRELVSIGWQGSVSYSPVRYGGVQIDNINAGQGREGEGEGGSAQGTRALRSGRHSLRHRREIRDHKADRFRCLRSSGLRARPLEEPQGRHQEGTPVPKQVINAFEDLIDAKRIVREIKLLKFFKHDNIIGLVDILKPEARTGYTDIYIITDLMETDLHRVIYSRQELSDEHIQYFVYQILRGLLFMHSANVLHRDLKPSNLLLNKSCDLQICDLGLARGYVEEEEEKTEYVVTRWYRAPEVILNASEYTKAVDIWSVGCILAELFGRQPLFPGEDFLDQVQRIISVLGTPSSEDMKYIGNENAIKYIKSLPKRSRQSWQKLFPNIKPTAADLLSKMLTFNPDKRYTVEECLAHPYFDGLHDEQQEIISKKMFDWSWDSFKPTKEILQNMVYEESLFFHPEPAEQPKKPKRDLKEFAYGSKYKFYQEK